jgi:hypothetical protein
MVHPFRKSLPSRREVLTQKVEFVTGAATHAFYVSAGFIHGTTEVVEVFYGSGLKEGTDLRAAASDACVLVSMLLQTGYTVDQIAHSLATTDDPFDPSQTLPGSIIGAIVRALASIDLSV